MKRICISVAVCLLFVLGPGVCARAGVSFEITPGVGYFTGYTKYDIGNVPKADDIVTPPRDPYFPISELKFPLMTWWGTINAKAAWGPFSLSGGYGENFTHNAGKMRDYDWGMPYYDASGPDGPGWYVNEYVNPSDSSDVAYDLDVASNSRTHLDGKIWNVQADWQFFSYSYDYYDRDFFTGEGSRRTGDISLSLGIGYEKRSFDFETTLLQQWSPSGHNDIYYYEGDGSLTGTYSIDYSIPYAALGMQAHTGKFSMDMSFAGSCFVDVDDRDVHLARVPGPIVSTGSLDGNSLELTAHFRYDITPHIFMGLAGNYMYIHTSGTQHQHIDAGSATVDYSGTPTVVTWSASDYDIREKTYSLEAAYMFEVWYRFGK